MYSIYQDLLTRRSIYINIRDNHKQINAGLIRFSVDENTTNLYDV